jgi:hypothetical protein
MPTMKVVRLKHQQLFTVYQEDGYWFVQSRIEGQDEAEVPGFENLDDALGHLKAMANTPA